MIRYVGDESLKDNFVAFQPYPYPQEGWSVKKALQLLPMLSVVQLNKDAKSNTDSS